MVEFIDIIGGRTGNHRVSSKRLVKEATNPVIRTELGVSSLKGTRVRAQGHLEGGMTGTWNWIRDGSGFRSNRKTLSVNRKKITGWLTQKVDIPPVNRSENSW